MRRQPTTRLQISGHRFLMRRIEHALVRGDARMLDDPLAAQSISLVIGAVLAVVAVAVVAVLAVLRPAGDLGDAPIVLVRESGALYVRIDDRVHPVFNLASARLVAGSPAEPRIVSQRAVDRALRGPMVGIPDAPPHLAPTLADAQWTVCDDARSELTTVIAGAVPRDLADGHSVLVTAREEPAATYLLYGAWRARPAARRTRAATGVPAAAGGHPGSPGDRAAAHPLRSLRAAGDAGGHRAEGAGHGARERR